SVQAGPGEAIPDRRQGAQIQRVGEAISLRRVLVNAVGERLRHDRGEVPVTGRPAGRGVAGERQALLRVVADGVLVVVARPEPAVARSTVKLDPPALEGVSGIGAVEALEL